MPPFNRIVCLFFLVLTACTSAPPVISPQAAFDVDERALTQGILRITLPEHAPKNFAIQAPTGQWFVLQEADEAIEIMPQAQFEAMQQLEFEIKRLQGVTWKEGRKVTEQVFSQPGRYTIYFADNLETEPENTFSFQKIVHYTR